MKMAIIPLQKWIIIVILKKIITYQKRSTEPKGGCDYIFVADNNGKHYELDSFCI